MGDFPSGQRGQTVNLLSLTSVVRIHHPPPSKDHCIRSGFLFGGEIDGEAADARNKRVSLFHFAGGSCPERSEDVVTNPPSPTNKKGTFVYQKFLFCLSKPQAWHIITTQSCISSAPLGLYLITRQRVFSCGLMI